MSRGRWAVLLLAAVVFCSGCCCSGRCGRGGCPLLGAGLLGDGCGLCGRGCWPRLQGVRGCGGLGYHDGCASGLGCGPAYWGDWYEGRSSCWDPCDWCGNYTGPGGGLPASYDSYTPPMSDDGYMQGAPMGEPMMQYGAPSGMPTPSPTVAPPPPTGSGKAPSTFAPGSKGQPTVAPPPPGARKPSSTYRHR